MSANVPVPKNDKLLSEAKKLLADIESGKNLNVIYPTYKRIGVILGPRYESLNPVLRRGLGLIYVQALISTNLAEKLSFTSSAIILCSQCYIQLFGNKSPSYQYIMKINARFHQERMEADQYGDQAGGMAVTLAAVDHALTALSPYVFSGAADISIDMSDFPTYAAKETKNGDEDS
jgi:ribosomal protein L33